VQCWGDSVITISAGYQLQFEQSGDVIHLTKLTSVIAESRELIVHFKVARLRDAGATFCYPTWRAGCRLMRYW
jgi:hypothetical protein